EYAGATPGDLRRIRSCQDPGAAHGVADRVAADSKISRKSVLRNCSKSSASSSRADLPRGSTKRCSGTSNRWRADARARGVVVGPKTYRRLSDKPRGRRPDIFNELWAEMVNCLVERPDQTALELLVEFQARYAGRYSLRQLHTLQRRVRAWRREAVQRLVHHMDGVATDVSASATARAPCARAS